MVPTRHKKGIELMLSRTILQNSDILTTEQSNMETDLFSSEPSLITIAILRILENAHDVEPDLSVDSQFLDNIFKMIVCDQ